MFEQILSEIKNKYKDLGLNETLLKAKARQIAKAVKEETEIAEAVAELEDELKYFQSMADQNRTLKKELEELKKPKDEKPKETEKPKDDKKAGEEPNPMLELLKELKSEIAGIKAEKVHESFKDKAVSKLKESGVSEQFYKLTIDGRKFESEEDVNDYVQLTKNQEDELLKSLNIDKLKTQSTPQFGSKAKEGELTADEQAYINSLKPKNESN